MLLCCWIFTGQVLPRLPQLPLPVAQFSHYSTGKNWPAGPGVDPCARGTSFRGTSTALLEPCSHPHPKPCLCLRLQCTPRLVLRLELGAPLLSAGEGMGGAKPLCFVLWQRVGGRAGAAAPSKLPGPGSSTAAPGLVGCTVQGLRGTAAVTGPGATSPSQ